MNKQMGEMFIFSASVSNARPCFATSRKSDAIATCQPDRNVSKLCQTTILGTLLLIWLNIESCAERDPILCGGKSWSDQLISIKYLKNGIPFRVAGRVGLISSLA